MKHSFAATNPCHVYDLALALQERDGLGTYYSGYPRWRLRPPAGFPLRSRSWRTLVTYGMQRWPERLRVDDARMFRWQDAGFDKAVAGILSGEGFIHGLPGQCRDIFRAARRQGGTTVLNHASGPMKQWRALVAPEYERVGKQLDAELPLPPAYEERLEEEVRLADIHCVASSVVRDQLMAEGIAGERIWVVPYGADRALFPKRKATPSGPFRICFAGRQSLRKGVHYLLKALEAVDSSGWELHCFGMPFAETAGDFNRYTGGARVIQRGSLSQQAFAEALQEMDVLVLPSAEEAFGLVVVQALQVGVPCIVSDRVGAKDLVRAGLTGTIAPFGDPGAIAAALQDWRGNRTTVEDNFPWADSAESLIAVGDAYVKNASNDGRG
jgi:glycosyltransferase involved in cell wall biosynthesis